MDKPLTTEEIQAQLETLPGWRHENDSLKKSFEFKNHREALSFIVRVSFDAEQHDHHPEIFNVYSTVKLTLRTHDAGNKVTMKDIELARGIEFFNWV